MNQKGSKIQQLKSQLKNIKLQEVKKGREIKLSSKIIMMMKNQKMKKFQKIKQYLNKINLRLNNNKKQRKIKNKIVQMNKNVNLYKKELKRIVLSGTIN